MIPFCSFEREYSRYLQTCPYFSKNLRTIMLGQKTISKYSSESQFKKCSRRQNTSVNSYFLLYQLLLSCRQPYKSAMNILGNSPWPHISLTSSDTEWRGHTLLHPTSVYTRHSFIFSLEQAPEDYSSIDLCRIFLASSRQS